MQPRAVPGKSPAAGHGVGQSPVFESASGSSSSH